MMLIEYLDKMKKNMKIFFLLYFFILSIKFRQPLNIKIFVLFMKSVKKEKRWKKEHSWNTLNI